MSDFSGWQLANHFKNPLLANDNTLHVIGVITNPARWHSRLRLFKKWKLEMLNTPNVSLHVIEGVYGDRQGECYPDAGEIYNYHLVQLESEVWLKENMINIGVKNLLPHDWKYMAWIDCDVSFRRQDWALETLHQLQTFQILQPWSHSVALNFEGGVKSQDSSFGYLWTNKKKMTWGRHKFDEGYAYAHSGYAWACTRKFYENIGQLLDFCITGSGDHHMAWACIGLAKDTIHGGMTKGYFDATYEWQRKALIGCKYLVGYVDGLLEHGFHGPDTRRNYGGRWKILVDNAYDPLKDIAYDKQGVIELVGPNAVPIETALISYNRDRKEDSIENY